MEPTDPSSQPVSDFSHRETERALTDAAWDQGSSIPGNDPALWRKDRFGAWIHRLDYGRRQSEFGWEIGEGAPPGEPSVPIPLQWQNYLDSVASRTRRQSQSRSPGGGPRLV